MLKKILIINWFVFVSLLGLFLQSTQAEDKHVNLYKDKNGYFTVLPPAGWRQEDYPSETIRSKVAFQHPTEKDIVIRIISAPTPFQNYTLDDLYQETKEKIDSLFRQKFPSVKCNLTKREVEGRQAVVQRNSGSPIGEQEIVMFINKGLYYSIAFNTLTNSQFEKNYKTFQRFLTNFIILEAGKKFSEQEIRDGLISKYKRVAELYEQMGRIEDALDFVKEGIAIDPNNKDLIAIEKRLQTKRGRK